MRQSFTSFSIWLALGVRVGQAYNVTATPAIVNQPGERGK